MIWDARDESEAWEAVHEWWEGLTWEQRVELVQPEDYEGYEKLLEFANGIEEIYTAAKKVDWQKGIDNAEVILGSISEFLYCQAENCGVTEEEFGKRLAGEYK